MVLSGQVDTVARVEQTVMDRLVAALGEERARWQLERGAVHLNGKLTTDPSIPAPKPHSRIVLRPPAASRNSRATETADTERPVSRPTADDRDAFLVAVEDRFGRPDVEALDTMHALLD